MQLSWLVNRISTISSHVDIVYQKSFLVLKVKQLAPPYFRHSSIGPEAGAEATGDQYALPALSPFPFTVSLLLRRTGKNKSLQSTVTVHKLELLRCCFSALLRSV